MKYVNNNNIGQKNILNMVQKHEICWKKLKYWTEKYIKLLKTHSNEITLMENKNRNKIRLV